VWETMVVDDLPRYPWSPRRRDDVVPAWREQSRLAYRDLPDQHCPPPHRLPSLSS
jgi:hypothetical protein